VSDHEVGLPHVQEDLDPTFEAGKESEGGKAKRENHTHGHATEIEREEYFPETSARVLG
jgi:hypothetical protein